MDLVVLCRGPPGCCRDARPASVTHWPGSPGVWRLAKRFKFAVPRRGTGRVKPKTCLEGLPFLSFPPAVRGSPYPTAEAREIALFSIFFDFFRVEKNVEKHDRQKTTFFALFCDFGPPRRRFLAVFGAETSSRRLLFRRFFENGHFVKIALPPMK